MILDQTDHIEAREDPEAGYDYRRDCVRGFEEAAEALESALARHGFTVRIVHDIQATLAAKGFTIKPIRIYEVEAPRGPGAIGGGAAPSGAESLTRLVPCRVNVFVEGDGVVVTALRPTLLCRVFPDELFDDVAVALERVLVAVVDEAAGV